MEGSRILLIEENAKIRCRIAEIFLLAKYHVITASSGKIGIQLCRQHEIDLILCNINMKEMDGFGVLSILSNFPETDGIPFIFMIKERQFASIRRAMEMGAEGFLLSPFNDAELLNTVQTRLKKKYAQQALFDKKKNALAKSINNLNDLSGLKKVVLDITAKQIRRKQVVYYERDRPTGVYLVVSGKVKTFIMDEYGHELITGIYLPDEYFGLQAFILNDVYKETAEAMESSEVINVPAKLLEEYIAEYPSAARKVMNILTQSLIQRDEQLLEVAYFSVRKRVAGAIIRLSQKMNPNGKLNRLRIQGGDLASVVGIATETLSRVLRDLKAEGIIDKRDNEIIIIKEEALLNMKN